MNFELNHAAIPHPATVTNKQSGRGLAGWGIGAWFNSI